MINMNNENVKMGVFSIRSHQAGLVAGAFNDYYGAEVKYKADPFSRDGRVSDPEEFRQRLQTDRYDMIITGQNGLTILQEVGYSGPVVVMSAYNHLSRGDIHGFKPYAIIRKSASQGLPNQCVAMADHYFRNKPINPELLENVRILNKNIHSDETI